LGSVIPPLDLTFLTRTTELDVSNRESPEAPKALREIPFYNLLWVDLSTAGLTISYADPISKDDVSVASLNYAIDPDEMPRAGPWATRLLDLAYGDAQRNKRLKVLINPHSGKCTASDLYHRYAEPIFAAAQCVIDLETTRQPGHATDIAEHLDIDKYDAIVPCSGDGLAYEVFNGLAKKPNAADALFKVAVALLPCGSGNAMAWNLYGTGSVSLAALSIVKGLRMPLDLASVTQGSTRTLSFLSQTFGIVAELDVGTDHIRWMGPTRFTYGFLVRLLRQSVYPCDVALKTEIADKKDIKSHYLAQASRKPQLRGSVAGAQDPPEGGEGGQGGLPPLKYGTVHDEIPPDWEVISCDVLSSFYAGNMAYMSKDSNFFPASLPNDGLIDLAMVDGTISRLKYLSMMQSLETGALFDMPELKARKVSAYRLVPKNRKDGYISVDGERVCFDPFQVEVHRGLGTVLSKSGHLYEAKGVV
jgi:sphingosine kinase